jgi:hypothetical protein
VKPNRILHSSGDSISIRADGCSVDHKLQDAKDVGWITISNKHKALKEGSNKGKEGQGLFYYLLFQWD